MTPPASPHFTPLSLQSAFNARRDSLRDGLRAVDPALYGYGAQVFQGIPFTLGAAEADNVVLLEGAPASVDLGGLRATYLVCLHAVEDQPAASADLPNTALSGNALGDCVARYELVYADGTTESVPIRRRFEIQQSRIRWGASPFLAVPAMRSLVFLTTSEAQELGRSPFGTGGRGELRHRAGRDAYPEHLWVYALPVGAPDKPLRALRLLPEGARTLLYALTATALLDHPLRAPLREKARLAAPSGTQFNALDGLDGLELDLGHVLVAQRALDYDAGAWAGDQPDVQPSPSATEALLEYAAHPAAQLFAGEAAAPLADLYAQGTLTSVAPSSRPVQLRVVDSATGQPIACRLHLHGQAGEYLPPRGYHRKVNAYWFEDNYAEFANGRNQYAYVPGECVADLPLGHVYIEASRGLEYQPYRGVLVVEPGTETVTLELARTLDWRQAGWVTADTHVHFLSPQTALLEAAAEGVNVVNLLASQWGEMFSNVGDYDGRSVLGARDFGGSGEFLVRVGTENRQQVLGHISLLGYAGPMIQPLCTGGPSEAALGDPLEVSMAAWAEQCRRQGGLVVMPHAPDPQGERAADVVLGLADAIEMMTFNPYNAQLSPVGLADWYRFLNLGYHLPVVGGSDKMSASSLLGGIRTYAQLGEREFTYANWMQAVRGGHTFATVGPLVSLTVEGQVPGQTVALPAGGGTLDVAWRVESASVPVDLVELVAGGQVVESWPGPARARPYRAAGSARVRLERSTWLALRVRGSYRARPGDVAAHSSAVQVVVADQPIFNPAQASELLQQIEGIQAYVDVLAPRADAAHHAAIQATLAAAHARLHGRLHQHGQPHSH